MLALGACCWAAGGCAGSGSHTPTAAELALERSQFAQVASGLRAAMPAVARELAAARAVWPTLANGLPPALPSGLPHAIAAAGTLARALPEPAFLASAERLTGPAAGLGGLYETFMRLCERAWRLTQTSIATIARGPSTTARWAAANATVYIDAIYDSHYDLSLLGKQIAEGYARLGGSRGFRRRLSQATVDALASAYSIASVRLAPHPGPGAELK